jgi:uncharacterized protein (TIGR02996 family)
MGIEDAFLHDILAHPDDDAPRLIYADWLDERGDPRGEFIRVQCALARLDDEDPRRWPLEEREQALLQAHKTRWRESLTNGLTGSFRRGFIEAASMRLTECEDFFVEAERSLTHHPIRKLELIARFGLRIVNERSTESLLRLTESPLLGQLHGLVMTGFSFNDGIVRAFAASPYLRQLRELKLSQISVDDVARLRELVVLPSLSDLTKLHLDHIDLSVDVLRLLVNSSGLRKLSCLHLSGNRLSHEAIAVLAESRLLGQLETLHLDYNILGDAGAISIRDWPSLPRLKRLSLRRNQFFAGGMQALAEAPALRGLISLNLFDNISCDAGAIALAAGDWPCLRALNLRFNGIGDLGVRAIAQAKSLGHLTHLDLTTNRITAAGGRALAESSALANLSRLDLLRNDLDEKAHQRLRERFGPYVYC